jgi:hypothetical protein
VRTHLRELSFALSSELLHSLGKEARVIANCYRVRFGRFTLYHYNVYDDSLSF